MKRCVVFYTSAAAAALAAWAIETRRSKTKKNTSREAVEEREMKTTRSTQQFVHGVCKSKTIITTDSSGLIFCLHIFSFFFFCLLFFFASTPFPVIGSMLLLPLYYYCCCCGVMFIVVGFCHYTIAIQPKLHGFPSDPICSSKRPLDAHKFEKFSRRCFFCSLFRSFCVLSVCSFACIRFSNDRYFWTISTTTTYKRAKQTKKSYMLR